MTDSAVDWQIARTDSTTDDEPKEQSAGFTKGNWFHQFNFADLAEEDYDKITTGIAQTPVQYLLQKLCSDFEVELTSFVINCCETLAD